MRTIIWQHGRNSNTKQRAEILKLLSEEQFRDAGCYSTSGTLHESTYNRKPALVFGCRCNIGGFHYPKYFSLVKTFASAQERELYARSLVKKLKKGFDSNAEAVLSVWDLESLSCLENIEGSEKDIKSLLIDYAKVEGPVEKDGKLVWTAYV